MTDEVKDSQVAPAPLHPACPNCSGLLSYTHNKTLSFFSCNGRCKGTFELHSAEDMVKFFKHAPAQERWYTKAELHDALIARNYEPKIADELAGWIADQLELAYKKGKERP